MKIWKYADFEYNKFQVLYINVFTINQGMRQIMN